MKRAILSFSICLTFLFTYAIDPMGSHLDYEHREPTWLLVLLAIIIFPISIFLIKFDPKAKDKDEKGGCSAGCMGYIGLILSIIVFILVINQCT